MFSPGALVCYKLEIWLSMVLSFCDLSYRATILLDRNTSQLCATSTCAPETPPSCKSVNAMMLHNRKSWTSCCQGHIVAKADTDKKRNTVAQPPKASSILWLTPVHDLGQPLSSICKTSLAILIRLSAPCWEKPGNLGWGVWWNLRRGGLGEGRTSMGYSMIELLGPSPIK